MLFTPPPSERQAHSWEHPVPRSADWSPPGWWWLGAHGGAAATSLERVSASRGDPWGQDAGRRWPDPAFEVSPLVVVVCRSHATGLEWARDLRRQHAAGAAPAGIRLLGVVVVADAPDLPRRLRDFQRLVVGGYDRAWYVPWLPEWRQTSNYEELPVPPDVELLVEELRATSRTANP